MAARHVLFVHPRPSSFFQTTICFCISSNFNIILTRDLGYTDVYKPAGNQAHAWNPG